MKQIYQYNNKELLKQAQRKQINLVKELEERKRIQSAYLSMDEQNQHAFIQALLNKGYSLEKIEQYLCLK